ncbi:MAG: ABC transporter substrate-binding protein [Oscillibacter sp.]|jgi:peptide/nickel transport system substrate-binding protein|nr:ABC transporter substrate-binding protein [Oscillibacter sp.]
MIKKHRLFHLVAALLLPVLLLTGCWQDSTGSEALDTDVSGDASTSSEESEESRALPSSFALPYYASQTLDPITCADGAQQTVAALLYEGLYELDGNLEPQGSLCSAASYDAASLTWTFTLRSGVSFSDGSALTPADVAATLQRAQVSDRYRARLACVASFSAANGAVIAVLNQANAGLPALLDIPIVKSGTQENTVPVGTGPYTLVTDDSGTYLSTNSSWWRGSTQPIKRISLVSCQDEDSSRFQFTSHGVQLISADLTGTNPVSATGSFDFYDADTPILQYLGFNTKNAVLADPALRQALGLGIDRETIVSAYLSGHAKAAQFPVSPVCAEYPTALATDYAYAAFETAMTNAGYNTGKTTRLTLLVNSENSFKVSAAKYLASALSGFDMKIEVESLPWADYTAALAAGQFDLYYGEVKLTAGWNLQPLIGTGGSLNYGGYSDAALDLMLGQYAASASRPAAMKTICTYLKKQAPILPVCFKCSSVLSQKGVVGNLTPTAANPFYDIGTCTINLAK